VAASTQGAVLDNAAANSSRRPASRNARIAAVTSDPSTTLGARWRRVKSRSPAVSCANRRARGGFRNRGSSRLDASRSATGVG